MEIASSGSCEAHDRLYQRDLDDRFVGAGYQSVDDLLVIEGANSAVPKAVSERSGYVRIAAGDTARGSQRDSIVSPYLWSENPRRFGPGLIQYLLTDLFIPIRKRASNGDLNSSLLLWSLGSAAHCGHQGRDKNGCGQLDCVLLFVAPGRNVLS